MIVLLTDAVAEVQRAFDGHGVQVRMQFGGVAAVGANHSPLHRES